MTSTTVTKHLSGRDQAYHPGPSRTSNFLTKSGDLFGNVQGSSADLEPGQTQRLNCMPTANSGITQTARPKPRSHLDIRLPRLSRTPTGQEKTLSRDDLLRDAERDLLWVKQPRHRHRLS